MAWKLATQDRSLILDVDASDNGPMHGTLIVEGTSYPVSGNWVASFSVPGRNHSAFSLAGNSAAAAPTFVAASGIMIGAGQHPTQIDLQVDVSSSADGSLLHYGGTMVPAVSALTADVRRFYFFLRNQGSNRVLTAPDGAAAGSPVTEADQIVPAADTQLWTVTAGGSLTSLATGHVLAVTTVADGVIPTLRAFDPHQPGTTWHLTTDGGLAISAPGPSFVLQGGLTTPGTPTAIHASLPDTAPAKATQRWLVVRTELEVPPPVDYAIVLSGTGQAVQLPAIPFGVDDFTVETWVKTTVGGPLCSSVTIGDTQGFVAAIEGDGTLVFGLLQNDPHSPAQQIVSSQPTVLLDGDWHHVACVRRGVQLAAYVDGEPCPLLPNTPWPEPIALDFVQQALIGTALEPPALTGPDDDPIACSLSRYWFAGALDDVRFWTRALTDDEIAYGMHHVFTGNEANLAGCWTFDQHDAADSSVHGGDGVIQGVPSFVASDIDLAPQGEPYLTTQAKLMQDYLVDDGAGAAGSLAETTAYRVVITARDARNAPLPCYITLWADQAVVASFLDGSSGTLGPDGPGYTRQTTSEAELSFALRAGGNLTTAILKVRADFMAPIERLVVSPDRHAHALLATMTGNQLLGLDEQGQPLPQITKGLKAAPLPAGTSPDAAGAVAQAIAHAMSTAVDHDVQPARPLTRRRSLPEDLPAPRPYRPRYQNVRQLTQAYDQHTDAITTHFLSTDDAVCRILVSEQMPNPHWVWDCTGNTFAPLTAAEVASRLSGKSIKHLDPLTTFFNGQLRVAARSDQMLGFAEGTLTRRWFGESLFDAIADAASVVVSSVETVVTDVASGIATVVTNIVVTVVSAVGDAVDAVLQTVEDAVAFVGAALKKVGAAVEGVVTFLRSVFDWNDILLAHTVIERYLEQSRFVIKAAVNGAGASAIAAIDQFRTDVDAKLDGWIASASGHTLQSHADNVAAGPPQDIQGNFLSSMVRHNARSTNASGSTDFSAEFASTTADLLTKLTAACETYITSLPDEMRKAGLMDVLSDPGALLNRGLEILLRALKPLIDGALVLADAVVAAIVTALDALLDALYDFCSGRIVIPFVTDFYERVVMKGNGSTLSLFSLISLAGAVPATVAWKLASGTDTPLFSTAERDHFLAIAGEQYNWMNLPGGHVAARNPILEPGVAARLTIGMGFVNAVAVAFWGIAVTVGDLLFLGTRTFLLPVNPKFEKPLVFFLVIGQLVAYVATFPWATDFDKPLDRLAFAMWAMQIIPFISNCVAIGITAWQYPGDAALCGSFGVVFLILSVSLWIARQAQAESVDNTKEGLGNLFAALTTANQLLRLVPNLYVAVAAVAMDALGFLSMTVMALVRASLDAYAYNHPPATGEAAAASAAG